MFQLKKRNYYYCVPVIPFQDHQLVSQSICPPGNSSISKAKNAYFATGIFLTQMSILSLNCLRRNKTCSSSDAERIETIKVDECNCSTYIDLTYTLLTSSYQECWHLASQLDVLVAISFYISSVLS